MARKESRESMAVPPSLVFKEEKWGTVCRQGTAARHVRACACACACVYKCLCGVWGVGVCVGGGVAVRLAGSHLKH